MNRIFMRRASAYAVVLIAALALAPSAFAHAELFPRSLPSGDGQLLQLTVPNEKDDASTTEIVMTIPAGFELESVAPEPGWKATIAGQKAMDGEMGGGNSVTWKGKLSGTDLAVLAFTGVPKNNGDYAFDVRQTYSDGSVVQWSGAEASDTPSARIQATAATGSSSGSRDSPSTTIAIIALVVGALGLLVGGAALLAGRRTT